MKPHTKKLRYLWCFRVTVLLHHIHPPTVLHVTNTVNISQHCTTLRERFVHNTGCGYTFHGFKSEFVFGSSPSLCRYSLFAGVINSHSLDAGLMRVQFSMYRSQRYMPTVLRVNKFIYSKEEHLGKATFPAGGVQPHKYWSRNTYTHEHTPHSDLYVLQECGNWDFNVVRDCCTVSSISGGGHCEPELIASSSLLSRNDWKEHNCTSEVRVTTVSMKET